MARTFTSTGNITMAPGALSTWTFGTVAAVVRKTTDGTLQVCWSLGTSFDKAYIAISDTNKVYAYTGVGRESTFTVLASEGWVLVGFSKPTGTSAYVAHKYVFATDTWTHETLGTSADNTAVGGGGYTALGSSGGIALAGDIAATAVWSRALSNADFEQLPTSLVAWHALAPSAFWVLDQSATSQRPVDLTGGGASQTSTSGTSVAASSVPILGYGGDPLLVESSAPWGGELANTGGGQADETAVTTGNSAAGGDPWNAVTVSVGGEVTYDVVNGSTWHRFATAATSGQSRVEWTSASITAPMARIYGGFWFRIPAAALGATNIYLMRARAATVQTTRISVSTGNKLQIRNTSNSAADQGATNIAADTDYFVRYDVTVGASAAGTVELYSSTGTLIETIAPTGVNFGTASVDEVGYGIASNISNQSPYLVRGMVSSANAWPAPPSAGTPAATGRAVAAATVTAATAKTVAAAGRVVAVASLAATAARRTQVAGAVAGAPISTASVRKVAPAASRVPGAPIASASTVRIVAAAARVVGAAVALGAARKSAPTAATTPGASLVAATARKVAPAVGRAVAAPLAVGGASSGIPPRTGRLVGVAGITTVATKVVACTARQISVPTVRTTTARTTRASSTVVAAAPIRATSARRSPGTGVVLAVGACVATSSRRSPAAGRTLAAATVVGVAAQPGNVRPALGRLVGAPFARARIRRVIRRPNSGTIARPSSGVISRPISGVIPRP